MPVTLLLLFGYQVIQVMNVQMGLQKLSAQQSPLWSAQPLISFHSSQYAIVKCGRLNGMDALLINCTLSNLTLVTAASHISLVVMLLYSEDFAFVTHVLLIYVYSLVIANDDECKCHLTVKHILLECCSLQDVREKYFTCSWLRELFEKVDATTIIDFIK